MQPRALRREQGDGAKHDGQAAGDDVHGQKRRNHVW